MVGSEISHYKILDELGRGGMGIVYRAEDQRLGRSVAIKVLPAQEMASEEEKARFSREAHAAAQLSHPNIATIHEIDEDEGRPFIVMEFVEGETLGDKIAGEPLPFDEACSIASQIADGLHEAHEKGIVHRDVKAQNIMLTEKGRVKILDFGLAKIAEDLVITRTGSTVGTTGYMSPEQVRGEKVTWHSDAWSLGILLYEMLAGKRPFEGAYELAINYQILNDDPPPLADVCSGVPENIVRVVEQLLSKTASERAISLADVVTALGPFTTGGSGTATIQKVRPKLVSKANRKLWIGGGIIGVVVLAFLAGMIFRGTGSDENTFDRSLVENIAVLPFEVRGDTTLNVYSETAASLLSTNLDGVGNIRSVDFRAVNSHLQESNFENLNPKVGSEVAADLTASRFVLGKIVRLGSTIQLSTSLYRVDGTGEQEFEARVTADSLILEGIDDLARELIASLVQDTGAHVESLPELTSTSFEAYREYIEGVIAIRAARFENAYAAFKRATDIDSTFALAWYRMGITALTRANLQDLAEPAFQRAILHGESHPLSLKKKYDAALAREMGYVDEAERLLEELTRDYPDDALAWSQLGETLFHTNFWRDRPISEARVPLQRALDLDPHNASFMIHLIEFAMEDENFDEAERLYPHISWYWVESLYRYIYPLYRELASESPDLRNKAIASLADSGAVALEMAATEVVYHLEDFRLADTLYSLAAELAEDRAELNYAIFGRAFARQAMGQTEKAYLDLLTLDSWYGWPPVGSVLLWTPRWEFPEDRVVDARSRWREWPPDSLKARGIWAGQTDPLDRYVDGVLSVKMKDDASVANSIDYLDRWAATSKNDTLAASLARRLEAQMSFRDGDWERTIDRVDASRLGPTGSWTQMIIPHFPENIMKAVALWKLGYADQALEILEALGDGFQGHGSRRSILASVAPSYLLRAQIYEKMERIDEAIEYYRRFIETWEDADPEFQPQVTEARERLNALLLVSE